MSLSIWHMCMQLGDGQGLPDARTARPVARSGSFHFACTCESGGETESATSHVIYSVLLWPVSRRSEARRRLRDIPRTAAGNPRNLHYEAHQPPLAYTLLAAPERLLALSRCQYGWRCYGLLRRWQESLLLLAVRKRLFSQLRS